MSGPLSGNNRVHHSIDGDLRRGRQFHARTSVLVDLAVVRYGRIGASAEAFTGRIAPVSLLLGG